MTNSTDQSQTNNRQNITIRKPKQNKQTEYLILE